MECWFGGAEATLRRTSWHPYSCLFGCAGRDREGNPTQVSRTVHGTKPDAQRVAAELTVKPARNAGGRKVNQLLDEWLEIKAPSWAPLTVRDQTSRSRL